MTDAGEAVYLYIALGVDQNIAWIEVSMDNIEINCLPLTKDLSPMCILQSAQDF